MLNKVFLDIRFTMFKMFQQFAKQLFELDCHYFIQKHYMTNVPFFNQMLSQDTEGRFCSAIEYGK